MVETTLGARDQDSTAVKPTPKCPTESWVSRLAEARSDDSAATPAAVRAEPVLATRSSSPCSRIRIRAGTPSSRAASAAFEASSTSTRPA